MYQFAYFLGTLLLLGPIWILFFYLRKDLRKKLFFTSITCGMLGPFSGLWFSKDYWRPEKIGNLPIGIEDILYCFLLGGVASCLYHVFLSTKPEKDYKNPANIWVMALLFGAAYVPMILLIRFGLNSVYASTFALIIMSCIMVFLRKYLIVKSIFSGLILMLLTLAGYAIFLNFFPEIFNRWWILENISRIYFIGVPIEELIWAFGAGSFLGILYDFANNPTSKLNAKSL
jgi:hypothetical protein